MSVLEISLKSKVLPDLLTEVFADLRKKLPFCLPALCFLKLFKCFVNHNYASLLPYCGEYPLVNLMALRRGKDCMENGFSIGVSKSVAATVLNSLKSGVVPRAGLEYITVGRKSEI